MITYQKVKFLGDGKTHTVFLRVARDTADFLSGVEVDKEGEDIEPPGFEQRLRVISKGFIVWRRQYKMDLHYGELVPMRKGSSVKTRRHRPYKAKP